MFGPVYFGSIFHRVATKEHLLHCNFYQIVIAFFRVFLTNSVFFFTNFFVIISCVLYSIPHLNQFSSTQNFTDWSNWLRMLLATLPELYRKSLQKLCVSVSSTLRQSRRILAASRQCYGFGSSGLLLPALLRSVDLLFTLRVSLTPSRIPGAG